MIKILQINRQNSFAIIEASWELRTQNLKLFVTLFQGVSMLQRQRLSFKRMLD